MVLGKCNNNYRLAKRLYAEQFSDRKHPNDRTIQRKTLKASDRLLALPRRHHVYNENDLHVLTVLAVFI